MKAKDFKEFISRIPDNDNVIFTYSMFTFENVGELLKGSKIKKYFKDEGYDDSECDDIPHGKKDWMIEFDN